MKQQQQWGVDNPKENQSNIVIQNSALNNAIYSNKSVGGVGRVDVNEGQNTDQQSSMILRSRGEEALVQQQQKMSSIYNVFPGNLVMSDQQQLLLTGLQSFNNRNNNLNYPSGNINNNFESPQQNIIHQAFQQQKQDQITKNYKVSAQNSEEISGEICTEEIKIKMNNYKGRENNQYMIYDDKSPNNSSNYYFSHLIQHSNNDRNKPPIFLNSNKVNIQPSSHQQHHHNQQNINNNNPHHKYMDDYYDPADADDNRFKRLEEKYVSDPSIIQEQDYSNRKLVRSDSDNNNNDNTMSHILQKEKDNKSRDNNSRKIGNTMGINVINQIPQGFQVGIPLVGNQMRLQSKHPIVQVSNLNSVQQTSTGQVFNLNSKVDMPHMRYSTEKDEYMEDEEEKYQGNGQTTSGGNYRGGNADDEDSLSNNSLHNQRKSSKKTTGIDSKNKKGQKSSKKFIDQINRDGSKPRNLSTFHQQFENNKKVHVQRRKIGSEQYKDFKEDYSNEDAVDSNSLSSDDKIARNTRGHRGKIVNQRYKRLTDNTGQDRKGDSMRFLFKKHTFTSSSKQFQNTQPISLRRQKSISPVTNQNQFVQYYSIRMKENFKNLEDQKKLRNIQTDEITLHNLNTFKYNNNNINNNIPEHNAKKNISKTSHQLVAGSDQWVGNGNNVTSFSQRNNNMLQQPSSMRRKHNSSSKHASFKSGMSKRSMKAASRHASDNTIPGMIQEKKEENDQQPKTGMSLLAQILIKAREERKKKEEEEAAKNAQIQQQAQENQTSIIKPLTFKQKIKKQLMKLVIYPDQEFRAFWDLLITILVMITCVYAPYSLAFANNFNLGLVVMDLIINSIFFVDIFINMFSAYQDEDFKIVDNPKKIAKRYITSWFLVDLIAVIPFDLFLYSSEIRTYGLNKVTRMYRIIRLTRISRMFKVLHAKNHIFKVMSEYININLGMRRLIFMSLILILLQHVVACIWIFFGQFDSGNRNNWIYVFGYQDLENYELYITSFYFTVTTIMTVGYGDITAKSIPERLLCILLMLIGVISFSFATGAISQIISSSDQTEQKLKEKITTLESIQVEYNIEENLFNKIMKALKYDHHQNSKDVHEFMEELPTKLRLELAMAIHKKMYSGIKFFNNRDINFITWIGSYLRPINVQEMDFIFKEGEEISEVYFLVQGSAGYVLPRFGNKVYIHIKQGDNFGHVDLANDRDYLKHHKLNKKKKKKQQVVTLLRIFTVQAQENCDLLTLTLEDLDKMNTEFPSIAKELLENAAERLNQEVAIKVNAIREQELLQAKKSSDLRSRFSAAFLSGLHKTIQIVEQEKRNEAKERENIEKRKSITASRAVLLSGLHRTKSNLYNGRKQRSQIQSVFKENGLTDDDNTGRGMNTVKNSSANKGENFSQLVVDGPGAQGPFERGLSDVRPGDQTIPDGEFTPVTIKNKNVLNIQRQALDFDKRVSFGQSHEITERESEYDLDNSEKSQNQKEGGEANNDMDGVSGNEQQYGLLKDDHEQQRIRNGWKPRQQQQQQQQQQQFSNFNSNVPIQKGSRFMTPSQHDDFKSGQVYEYSSEEESEQYYDEEDELDSDESDETLIILNEIKHTMSRMYRKVERIDRQMKSQREEQRNIRFELQNLLQVAGQNGFNATLTNNQSGYNPRATYERDNENVLPISTQNQQEQEQQQQNLQPNSPVPYRKRDPSYIQEEQDEEDEEDDNI